MSNYIAYKDSLAFHPGYYIEEIVEESGLTQEDFAKRLGTTPKNLSLLIRGKQSLSVDMAMKLSRMLGTTMQYWLNLQNAYDTALAQIESEEELEREKNVLRMLGYSYFRDNFDLPDLPRKIDEQVEKVRAFLGVATLTVLTERDMAVSFRSSTGKMSKESVARANAMVQIATNKAIGTPAPKFNKKKFEEAIDFALTQTTNHAGFYPLIRDRFLAAGVVLVVLPNLPGSKTNGATKRVGKRVMMMVNDRRLYADSFWFTLLHEAGHVINGDFGISFEGDTGDIESTANEYAENKLIDPELYQAFIRDNKMHLTAPTIIAFANSIDRDPGIVLGRLENDGYLRHDNGMQSLRRKYHVSVV
ncbi:MAG: HigA family addiction module antitoxin [Atopobiaceae bacterium]|nr:HigA family addiction module antitoxin [Atopobiaceae bacterium]